MRKQIEWISKGELILQHEKEVSDLFDLFNTEGGLNLQSFEREFPGIGRLRVRKALDS
tara:strand:- start:9 stop:182 length:174 start_codon:yes stop_codon:yes gene_type:complete